MSNVNSKQTVGPATANARRPYIVTEPVTWYGGTEHLAER